MTLCKWGSGQFGLVDRGGLGAAWKLSRDRERDRRGVGIHAGPSVNAGGGQFGLVDRGGLRAACRLSRAEGGVGGEWDSCWTFCEWVLGQFGLVDSGGLGAVWNPSRGQAWVGRGKGIGG